ncbi:MAG: Sua5/YciO/YrdC/YwlC family protein, partial [Candidatus Omnitrophica bacterium]|nr:Sua5/YciO/YrdC/YwlC family protein [Candidatus Omnitrophota bacterium]
CYVTRKERHLLLSPEAPIVLLQNKNAGILSENIAPRNPYLGVMLPYTPIHHLLMAHLQGPVVATSANMADEPICIDEFEAYEKLSGVADLFLVHDRPIVRHADDSIVRVIQGRPMVLRRARGYAPLPIRMAAELPDLVAYGGQLKSAIAVSKGRNIFLSQHIGDLENPMTWLTYKSVMQDFQEMFGIANPLPVCDRHPDYLSTTLAKSRAQNVETVQHHHAHIVACMAENQLSGKVLGIAWDGTGYGDDQTVWGGEFLVCDERESRRCYHIRPFSLPGGEQAVREPRRCALGLLWSMDPENLSAYEDLAPLQNFKRPELKNLTSMLSGGVAAPLTSSVGRLFDAMASWIGLVHVNQFEGQAAQQLEYAGYEFPHDDHYPYRVGHGLVDWEPMLRAVIADIRAGVHPGVIATGFQNTLVEMA